MKTKVKAYVIATALILLIVPVSVSFAQTTAFNFQGRLNDGTSPANGQYDLQFKLFDAITGGSQVGATLSRPGLTLVNGIFSTTLNFALPAFESGGNRFLEIAVRPVNSPDAYIVLGARQQILSVPFAVRATKAGTADFAGSAAIANSAINADNAEIAQNALKLGGVPQTGYARLNSANTGDISATNLAATTNLSVGGTATITGRTALNGNAVQPATAFGLPKAMIQIFNDGSITSCYNGTTGASTRETCGFVVTTPLGLVGVYRVNFNLSVSGRFVVATSEYRGTNSFLHNTVPHYAFINNTTIDFFLTRINSSTDTFDSAFMVVIF